MIRTRCPCCKGKLLPKQRIHPECIDEWAAEQQAKAARKAEREARARAKVDRATDRSRRMALETIPELIKKAQAEFNKWVRARDHEQPCISCRRPTPDMSQLHAGRDAGHYRSVGAAAHLRFNEDNCHAQCVHCNQWKAGKAVEYRIALVARIGLARVLALEADNTPHKWTREELRLIAATYRAKRRALEQQEKGE